MLSEGAFFDVLRQGLWVSVLVSIPILSVALLAGLLIGLFQALTSIQEMTLTFVPKLLAVALVLVLMGDVMPPGAMRAMQRRGPISSINWSFNLLDPAPQTRHGWWLAETASDHADEGYSSERLRLWNAYGKQMLSGIQAVAIFG